LCFFVFKIIFILKIEEEDRNRIKNIKEDEKKKASDEIENFKQIHKNVITNEVFFIYLIIKNFK
jgi:hypothetical protein